MSTSNNTSNNNTVLPGVTFADIEAPVPTLRQTIDRNNLNQSTIEETHTCFATCCAYSCVGITVLALLSPFIICDLYFAFGSISCQHDTNPVGITLSTWLEVAGFSLIGLIGSYVLMVGTIACCQCNPESMIIFAPIQWAFSAFSFAWLIVGCVLFWRYLDPSGNCARDVSDYMWARLIIGLIGVFVAAKTGDKKKK